MIGEWEDKCWGRTKCTHTSVIYSRHVLEVTQNTFCSFHWHEHRANIFRVHAGLVRVVWAYGWRLQCNDLGPGEYLRVPSLVPHQFQIIESGLMDEEYYADRDGAVKLEDIHRLSEGGAIPGDMPHPFAPVPVILLPGGGFWGGRQ